MSEGLRPEFELAILDFPDGSSEHGVAIDECQNVALVSNDPMTGHRWLAKPDGTVYCAHCKREHRHFRVQSDDGDTALLSPLVLI